MGSMRRGLPLILTLLAALVAACAVNPSSRGRIDNRVYVANESANSVSVINAVTLAPMRTVPLDVKGAHDLALTRDGRTLFVSNLLSGAVTAPGGRANPGRPARAGRAVRARAAARTRD